MWSGSNVQRSSSRHAAEAVIETLTTIPCETVFLQVTALWPSWLSVHRLSTQSSISLTCTQICSHTHTKKSSIFTHMLRYLASLLKIGCYPPHTVREETCISTVIESNALVWWDPNSLIIVEFNVKHLISKYIHTAPYIYVVVVYIYI